MPDELKPCPFCGGEAEVRPGHLYMDEVFKVRCTKCFAGTDFVFVDHPSIDGKTGKLKEETRYTEWQAKQKAIDAWNRRLAGELVEVVHGKWERSIYAEDFHRCSECSSVWSRTSKFCPNCGAKMDGEET